jgi:hypothetical protein
MQEFLMKDNEGIFYELKESNMKTAMQEAIELVKKYDNREIPFNVMLFNLELLLEKEKQQIINACWYGHDIKHEYFNPIHYIDKTYPQNK